jgi:DNA-binding transcriptional regulator YiaG
MTSDEFRAALKALGVRQRWLAARLGVDANTVNRWATGKLDVPQYAVAYVELLRDKGGPIPAT